MSHSFVPFVPSKPSESSGAGDRFKPVTTPAAPGSSPAGPAVPTAHPHPTHGEPQITLQRENDRVTQIRIQCACGQVIELDCEY